MSQPDRDILIGKIVAPFGVRGELKVLVLTEFPQRLESGREVTVQPVKDARKAMRITGSRAHKGGVLLKLEGVDSREDAELLRDASIVIDRSEVGELPDGSFYVFDLIGIKVVVEDGRELGEVTEILQSAANDVYVTSTGLCIPALKDVVADIDVKRGVITVRDYPGLLD